MAWDTEKTKRLLLDAARAEFARYGIAGARVNRIAKNAGVSKERIYGHFGNKEDLFNAVLADAMSNLMGAVRPGDGSVGEYVGRVFDYHRSDPTLLRLLMFEALHSGDSLAGDTPGRADWYVKAADSLSESTGYNHNQSSQLLLALISLAAWPTAMPQLTRLALTGGREGRPTRTEPNPADAGADADADADAAHESAESLRSFLVAFAERAIRD
jgi:AcrR family transcriptional regulator